MAGSPQPAAAKTPTQCSLTFVTALAPPSGGALAGTGDGVAQPFVPAVTALLAACTKVPLRTGLGCKQGRNDKLGNKKGAPFTACVIAERLSPSANRLAHKLVCKSHLNCTKGFWKGFWVKDCFKKSWVLAEHMAAISSLLLSQKHLKQLQTKYLQYQHEPEVSTTAAKIWEFSSHVCSRNECTTRATPKAGLCKAVRMCGDGEKLWVRAGAQTQTLFSPCEIVSLP